MSPHANQQSPDVMQVLRDYIRALEEAADLALRLTSAIPDAISKSVVAPTRNDAATIASLDAMDSFLASFGSIKTARENMLIGSRHLSTMRRGLGVPVLASTDTLTNC
jgi:hypothetical protein